MRILPQAKWLVDLTTISRSWEERREKAGLRGEAKTRQWYDPITRMWLSLDEYSFSRKKGRKGHHDLEEEDQAVFGELDENPSKYAITAAQAHMLGYTRMLYGLSDGVLRMREDREAFNDLYDDALQMDIPLDWRPGDDPEKDYAYATWTPERTQPTPNKPDPVLSAVERVAVGEKASSQVSDTSEDSSSDDESQEPIPTGSVEPDFRLPPRKQAGTGRKPSETSSTRKKPRVSFEETSCELVVAELGSQLEAESKLSPLPKESRKTIPQSGKSSPTTSGQRDTTPKSSSEPSNTPLQAGESPPRQPVEGKRQRRRRGKIRPVEFHDGDSQQPNLPASTQSSKLSASTSAVSASKEIQDTPGASHTARTKPPSKPKEKLSSDLRQTDFVQLLGGPKKASQIAEALQLLASSAVKKDTSQ